MLLPEKLLMQKKISYDLYKSIVDEVIEAYRLTNTSRKTFSEIALRLGGVV